MHEHEAADVQARMQDYEASDAFYLGMMDEADIVRLQARGFLIEDAPVTRVARARGVGTAQGITGPGRHSAVRTRIMRTETSAVDTMASAPGEATHTTSMNCVLDLAGPLFDRWRLILLQ
ncbi:MAG: hypothetical protein ABIW79_09350, partial [Gemmatimonas sp.]